MLCNHGVNLSYLLDIVHGGNHTFGGDIGFGVELTSIFGADNVKTTNSNSPNLDMITSGYTQFATTYSVGLHYFYKIHHQFFLTYQYRFYRNSSTMDIKTTDFNGGSNLII